MVNPYETWNIERKICFTYFGKRKQDFEFLTHIPSLIKNPTNNLTKTIKYINGIYRIEALLESNDKLKK